MDLNAMLDEALASLQRTVAMVDELSADMRRRNRVFLAVERRIERKNAANWRLLRELVGEAPGA
jgi:hypothetical protein